jgi:hypothetical protein
MRQKKNPKDFNENFRVDKTYKDLVDAAGLESWEKRQAIQRAALKKLALMRIKSK